MLSFAGRRLASSTFRLYGEPLPVNAPLKDSLELVAALSTVDVGTSVQLYLPEIEVKQKM
jgi:hypothetical protein